MSFPLSASRNSSVSLQTFPTVRLLLAQAGGSQALPQEALQGLLGGCGWAGRKRRRSSEEAELRALSEEGAAGAWGRGEQAHGCGPEQSGLELPAGICGEQAGPRLDR